MIYVFEKNGVWYAECDLEIHYKLSVNTAEPEYLTCYWKSDGHIVTKQHMSRLHGGRKIDYCRLIEVMEIRKAHMEKYDTCYHCDTSSGHAPRQHGTWVFCKSCQERAMQYYEQQKSTEK
jgi:hypothetical protein